MRDPSFHLSLETSSRLAYHERMAAPRAPALSFVPPWQAGEQPVPGRAFLERGKSRGDAPALQLQSACDKKGLVTLMRPALHPPPSLIGPLHSPVPASHRAENSRHG